MTFYCYHGTDYENVRGILSQGFRSKSNEEHWLGNGFYFYLDYSLAVWWTKNPSNKFGVEVITPAIIQCAVEVDEDDVLDLRKLSDYEKTVDIYLNDFLPRRFEQTAKKYSTIPKLRCAFFDYIYEQYKTKAFIGAFNAKNQPYLSQKPQLGFSEFNLPFIETQVCVFEHDIIKNIELCKKEIPKNLEVLI